MPPRDSMMSEASMAGPWPKRSNTLHNPYTMTVMSFARGLAPTPSQVTLASSTYSTTSQPPVADDAPPVPTIPEEYTRPHMREDDETDKAKSSQARTPAEELSAYSFPYDRERQQSIDETLAKLEGTYVSPNASDESLDPQHRAERQREKFEQWQREHVAIFKKNAQRRPSSPISLSLPPQSLLTGDGYPIPPPPPGERIPSLLFLTSEERRARAQKEFDAWCRQKRPDGKATAKWYKPGSKSGASSQKGTVGTAKSAADATKYYPHVADPKCLDGSSGALKGGINKAKDVVNGTSDTNNKTGRLPLTASQHAALAKRNIYPVIQAYPGVRFDLAPKGEPDAEQLPKDKAPLMSLSAAQQKFLGRPDLNPIFVAIPTHIATHIHAPQPINPVKIVGHPDRGTLFEDFIFAGDLPETADEAFTKPGDLPETADETFAEQPDHGRVYEDPPPPLSSKAAGKRPANHKKPPRQPAEKYAASYRRAIATPPPQSPANFNEIQHGDFPTHKRVLYDLRLSSHVEMPEFAHYESPREEGEAVAKSRRESQVLDFRTRDSSRFVLGEGGEWRQERMPAF